jgi:ankyrin repeat protein
LHGASYYGNDLVVQLLLQFGADTKIKNNFSNYAFEESKNMTISKNIKDFRNDVINILLTKLDKNNLSHGMRLLKKQGMVI